ncbi:MAG: hypothetical protein K2M42_08630 [Oscillospiraceae bacterium]|nr:hypothetical protein [Oscillospiraceae bacterium]
MDQSAPTLVRFMQKADIDQSKEFEIGSVWARFRSTFLHFIKIAVDILLKKA